MILLARLAGALLAAAEPSPLPLDLVDRALDDAPLVITATARLEVARANARALGVGDHEFMVSGSYIRRSVDREGGYDEFDGTLSRAIRLPGKAALDRRAGALEIEVAENRLEDARHQSALHLATLWHDWLAAEAEVALDAATVAAHAKALAAVERQVALKDASPLDADLARSALATAHAAEAKARGQAAAARTALIAHFPTLPLPATPPEIPPPTLPVAGLAPWRDLVISRSHEIRAAEVEAQRLAVIADRQRANRLADPSIGIRGFSERSGMERGLGIVASMPLGGSRRRAVAEAAVAERSAADATLVGVRREVQAIADADLGNAANSHAAWVAAAAAAESSRSVAGRQRTARRLGAADLATMLLAERQAIDADHAELMARVEAARALLKLKIDAHILWVVDDEDHAMR